MTDLERVELAARRAAAAGVASDSEIETRIAAVFESFAVHLAQQIKSKAAARPEPEG